MSDKIANVFTKITGTTTTESDATQVSYPNGFDYYNTKVVCAFVSKWGRRYFGSNVVTNINLASGFIELVVSSQETFGGCPFEIVIVKA